MSGAGTLGYICVHYFRNIDHFLFSILKNRTIAKHFSAIFVLQITNPTGSTVPEKNRNSC